MDLYLKNGEKAGLYDVAQWWIETYPEDVFLGLSDGPELVCEVRDNMKLMLALRKSK